MTNYRVALLACMALVNISPAWADQQETDPNQQLQALTARLEALNKRLDQMGAQLQAQQLAEQQTRKAPSANVDKQRQELAATKDTLKTLVNDMTVYGQIDLGVEHTSNVAGSGNVTRLSSGIGTSYVGVRGKDKIQPGLSAIWNLEAGFSPDNGTSLQGGRLFGRQSYVGLESDYGTLTFGRQYNVRFLAWKELNPFGAGSHGITTLDEGYTGTAREDNAIRYVVPLGGFTLGANYSFGRDAVKGSSVVASNCAGETDETSECREWAGMVKYDTKHWGLSSAYERIYGGTSATYGGLVEPGITDSRFLLGGYFRVMGTKVAMGWVKRDNEGIATPESNLLWIATSVPVAKNFSIDGMIGQLKYQNSADKAQAVVVRGVYSLSKQTELYVSAEHMSNSGDLSLPASNSSPKLSAPAGEAELSIISGIKFRF